jgi:hypothetical protein
MIDFVLQDASVPTFGFDELRITEFVEAMYAHPAETWNLGGIAIHAQAAFEKLQLRVSGNLQTWINQDVEVHGHTGACAYLLGSPRIVVLGAIFDDGKLQAESDLWRSEADTGSEAQGFQHVGDGLLELRAGDFIGENGPR